MVKAILLSALLVPVGLGLANVEVNYASTKVNDSFITVVNERNNLTITGIKEGQRDKIEYRIYNNESGLIDAISDDAFIDCPNIESLMLSYTVKYIETNALNGIENVFYTGSEEEYNSLNLTYAGNVTFYAYDEGFINYWIRNIRVEENTSICDMSKEQFNELYSLYKNLKTSDKKIVDQYVDIAGEKIGDSMKELIDMFVKKNPSRSKDEFSQGNAIGVIIVIALIGMTSICIFYLLKTKDVIS